MEHHALRRHINPKGLLLLNPQRGTVIEYKICYFFNSQSFTQFAIGVDHCVFFRFIRQIDSRKHLIVLGNSKFQ